MAASTIDNLISAAGLVLPKDSTQTDSGKTETDTNDTSAKVLKTITNNSGSNVINSGRAESTTNSGRTDTTYNSGRTDTSQLMLSDTAVNGMVQHILESTQGLAAVTSGQHQTGLYNSSTNQMLTNDLVSRTAADVEAKRAATVNTIGSSSSTTNMGGSLSITNIGGSNTVTGPSTTSTETTQDPTHSVDTKVLGGSTVSNHTNAPLGAKTIAGLASGSLIYNAAGKLIDKLTGKAVSEITGSILGGSAGNIVDAAGNITDGAGNIVSNAGNIGDAVEQGNALITSDFNDMITSGFADEGAGAIGEGVGSAVVDDVGASVVEDGAGSLLDTIGSFFFSPGEASKGGTPPMKQSETSPAIPISSTKSSNKSAPKQATSLVSPHQTVSALMEHNGSLINGALGSAMGKDSAEAISRVGKSKPQSLEIQQTGDDAFGRAITKTTIAVMEAAWIVCTELNRQGRLPNRYYIHGARVFSTYTEQLKKGYYIWAVPSTMHLRKHPNSLYSKFLCWLFNHRAEYLSAVAGCTGAKKTFTGKLATVSSYWFCDILSRTIARNYTCDVLNVVYPVQEHTHG